MDWTQVGGQLAQVGLPTLGTVLGGVFGGPLGSSIGGALGRTAAQAVGAALGVPPTPEAVSIAIAADPDGARTKLTQIEADVTLQRDLLADRANARSMQIEAIHSNSKLAWAPLYMATMNYLLFFTILFCVAKGFLREDGIMVGAVIGAWVASYSFFLGSTDGARRISNTMQSIVSRK